MRIDSTKPNTEVGMVLTVYQRLEKRDVMDELLLFITTTRSQNTRLSTDEFLII